MEKACRICKRLVETSECPACKNNDLTKNWKGEVVIFDATSELSVKSGHAIPGRYALQVL